MSESRKTFIYCRACFYPIDNDKYKVLEQVGVMNTLNQIFQFFLPHFNTKIKNPCLCSICFAMFLTFYEFKNRCSLKGKCLRSYLDANPQQGTVDLYDVRAHNNRDQTGAMQEPPRELIKTTHKRNWETTCRMCNLQFASKGDWERHCCHRLTIICFVCYKVFRDESKLKVHVEIQHEFACFLCRKMLKTRRALRKHNRMFHSSDLLEHKCRICEIYFTNRTSLKLHLRVAHKKKHHPECPDCGKPCLKSYKKHIASHKLADKTRFICNICKWVYFSLSGLKSHFKRRHKEIEIRSVTSVSTYVTEQTV